jgi:N-acetylglucosaminyldiphosphoundecaprenol N-acetyl-beta-D-mannosaminyltransferase
MIDFTSILDVKVSAINYSDALTTIENWIESANKKYVCVSAVHLIMECWKNSQLRDGVNQAGLVTPDGMPLVWLSKLYGHKRVERVYGPTLMLKLCEMAQSKRYRIFLLGGSRGQCGILNKNLLKKFPKLKIVGVYDTPVKKISKIENDKIIKVINHRKPNIVFVGTGCPYQELWMINNIKNVKDTVLIGVGAAFDFISGKTNQAPILIQNIGLEWLFRLIHQPRKLFFRYFVYNNLFCLIIIKQLFTDFVKFRIIPENETKNIISESNVPISAGWRRKN